MLPPVVDVDADQQRDMRAIRKADLSRELFQRVQIQRVQISNSPNKRKVAEALRSMRITRRRRPSCLVAAQERFAVTQQLGRRDLRSGRSGRQHAGQNHSNPQAHWLPPSAVRTSETLAYNVGSNS